MFPSTRNKLIGSEPDDWTRVQVLKDGQCGHEENGGACHNWTFGKKRELTFRKLMQRWKRVQKGMDIDIEAGKQLGEKEPADYWHRVWSDMHDGHGGPPGNLPNPALREKWTNMKDDGKTDEQCWDTLEIQYPVAFLGLPVLKRWENLGEGKPIEETKDDMFGWIEEFNRIFLKKELKEKLEEMKSSGEEDTFWKVNWDTVHKSDMSKVRKEDQEGFVFPVMERNENGDLVRREPKYKQYYPNEFRRRNCCVKSNSVENLPLFREFDFV